MRLLTNIIIIIIGILIQFSLSRYFAIGGLAPNFILIFIIFIALVRGSMIGQLFGFCWGLSWDILSVDLFGSYTLIYTCIGFFSGKLNRKLDESKPANQMILTLLASIIFWISIYYTYQIFGSDEFKLEINYIVFLQPIYNMVISPVVFFLGRTLVNILRMDEWVQRTKW